MIEIFAPDYKERHMCGPEPLSEGVKELLRQMDFDISHLHTESVGSGRVARFIRSTHYAVRHYKAQEEVEKFMHGLIRRNPGETEFHQAVREVAESLMPFILEHKEYQDNAILERLTEPDRIIIFRVCSKN